MTEPIQLHATVHFRCGRKGRKHLEAGEKRETPPGRVPRVARLMALAIRFERLIREGAVADQAELARLGHVSRARVTQIMNLLHLAPDIQEQILHLPLIEKGRAPIKEGDLRDIVAEHNWRRQRRAWAILAKHSELTT